MTFKLVRINHKYCDYLRKFDSRVPYNNGTKELRPFVGVLFKIVNKEYFAPLSSPKPKHLKMKNYVDFFKIDNGLLGVINFNNMIPVNKDNYEIIDLNKIELSVDDKKYRELLKNQIYWLNKNNIQVKQKSKKLYDKYLNKSLNKSIYERCCNFPLLEKKCDEYSKEKVLLK